MPVQFQGKRKKRRHKHCDRKSEKGRSRRKPERSRSVADLSLSMPLDPRENKEGPPATSFSFGGKAARLAASHSGLAPPMAGRSLPRAPTPAKGWDESDLDIDEHEDVRVSLYVSTYTCLYLNLSWFNFIWFPACMCRSNHVTKYGPAKISTIVWVQQTCYGWNHLCLVQILLDV